MLIKFVLKNLILVALIAFAINWVISTNIQTFFHKPVTHQSQLEELSGDNLMHESQILHEPQKDPS